VSHKVDVNRWMAIQMTGEHHASSMYYWRRHRTPSEHENVRECLSISGDGLAHYYGVRWERFVSEFSLTAAVEGIMAFHNIASDANILGM